MSSKPKIPPSAIESSASSVNKIIFLSSIVYMLRFRETHLLLYYFFAVGAGVNTIVVFAEFELSLLSGSTLANSAVTSAENS